MPKKILIIEDDTSFRNNLSNELQAAKFKVLEAENGKQGLAIALKEKPDLILLDILMPKMNGIEMLKKLRQDKCGKNARVIILTVSVDEKKVFQALEGGVHDYLIKADWQVEDVVEKIKERLK